LRPGTFLGETTSVLSKVAKIVYSIEPEPALFSKAEERFNNASNVKIIRGLSEEVFATEAFREAITKRLGSAHTAETGTATIADKTNATRS
jgi:protein-L-isoaspartate O-methyltransferase